MKERKNWFRTGILFPFLVTRGWLLLIGILSRYLPLNQNYPARPEVLTRGWHFSPVRFLDIWGRWDTNWYLTIIKQGYMAGPDLLKDQGNLAFSPLYPYLVNFFLILMPSFLRTDFTIFLTGVLISNFFLLMALVLLFKLTINIFNDKNLAGATIWYLLLFPTGFFLSCFYPESLFLFLVLLVFYLGRQKKWFWMSVAGFLLVLAKPPGFLIFIPALCLYLENAKWQLKNIKFDILFLLLMPLGLLIYFLIGFMTNGDIWACLKIHSAWKHYWCWPWEAFLVLQNQGVISISILEKITALVFLFFGFLSFFFFPSLSFGLFSVVYVVFLFCIGTRVSIIRYALPLFPVFILFAKFSKNNFMRNFIFFLLLILQTVFFVLWCQFYWIN